MATQPAMKELMPAVTTPDVYTPATFNTERLSNRALELFTANFGAERVKKTQAVMGGFKSYTSRAAVDVSPWLDAAPASFDSVRKSYSRVKPAPSGWKSMQPTPRSESCG